MSKKALLFGLALAGMALLGVHLAGSHRIEARKRSEPIYSLSDTPFRSRCSAADRRRRAHWPQSSWDR